MSLLIKRETAMSENEQQNKDNEDLQKKVDRIDDNVTALRNCVMGPAEDHSDEGMIGDVNKNTTFRKVAVWFLGVIVAAAATGWIYALVNVAKRISEGG